MSTDKQKIKGEFLEVVENHKMTIECDNGVHRSVYFADPDSFHGWFRLITWPGGLTITGDYGTFSFARITDMFKFFRTGDEKLRINCSYWTEKLISTDRARGHEEFSIEGNRFHIQEAYRNYAKKEPNPDHREYAREALRDAFDEAPESWEQLHAKLTYLDNDSIRTELNDALYDVSLDRLTTAYVWCLWAIAWGINQYDLAAKKAAA